MKTLDLSIYNNFGTVKLPLIGFRNLSPRLLTFVIDLTVTIDISLTDHLVDLLVCEFLAQICHHVTQLGRRDEAVAVLVEHSEGFPDLLFAIGVLHFACHHCKEFWEVNCAVACAEIIKNNN